MRICIIVRILWPGGVQRIAFAEADGLRKLGNDVDLIFIRATNRYTYSQKLNYKVLYGNDVNKRFIGRLFKRITMHYSPERGEDATIDIDLIYKTEHNLKKQYDIIYYFDEFSALFQKFNNKRYKNKTVVLIHEVKILDGSLLSRLVQRRAIKYSDIVLTNTHQNLDLLKRAGIKNAYEVYPGLVLHDKVPGFDMREDIVLSVTMWDSGRRPETLLEIAKQMKNGRLIIAGSWTDNNYFESFKNKLKNSNLENKVIVTGTIDENNLINIYKKAKISIRFGYDEKGPGMGSLESISYGLPLIIDENIGIREIIKDGCNGYIVEPEDSIGIAEKISLLFNDKNIWEKMSKNNLELAKSFSWGNHNEKLNKIFNDLLEEYY